MEHKFNMHHTAPSSVPALSNLRQGEPMKGTTSNTSRRTALYSNSHRLGTSDPNNTIVGRLNHANSLEIAYSTISPPKQENVPYPMQIKLNLIDQNPARNSDGYVYALILFPHVNEPFLM